MSTFKGPQNEKLQGGLGRRNPSTDNIMGLVMGGVAVAEKIALGAPAKLIQLQDAIALGIDAAYDSTNDVQVYYHIAEFFRINPDGTLYIMLVAKDTTQEDMWDVTEDNCALLFNTHKDIKVMATVLNPGGSYSPTVTNGIDVDAEAAIPKAQALVAALFADSLYLDACLIEGRNVSGTYGDLVDLTTKAAPNVAMVIGNDPAQVALDAEYAKTAAMGLALGSIGVRKVNESVGSVEIANPPAAKRGLESYSLTDVSLSRVLTAALSNSTDVAILTTTEAQTLSDKGYLFMGFFEGYDGFYWNSDRTCVESASDFATIQNNRVWNKAAAIVRIALIPKIRSVVPTTEAGAIAPSTVEAWQQRVNTVLEQMVKDEEISSFDFFIDPAQNVLAGNPIITQLEIVPTGTAQAITNQIGLTNPFKQ
jgi:hypothetical protein